MYTTWKYPLELSEWQSIEMPEDAEIIHVDVHPITNEIFMWAVVNPSHAKVKRQIAIVGTGHDATKVVESGNYIDTVMQGSFVWHIYDMGEVE